ncbi:hypothetical protein ACUN7V_17660 [Quadrisphaera oryzae]|uniref:hypothetical protein n=1 Tax=Quadrisphaera TaxID=317661 RepID=UPI00164769CD|nr:hypothetical protein [Quadrisphaera sp. RL12-1S]MBC3760191.1 hypothetical protein [Quadrisphaera sp. RL12-1S]
MAFDAGLPPTGWGTTSAAGPWWARSAAAPSSGVDPVAASSTASSTAGSAGIPRQDALTLGSDGPGSSSPLDPLGPDGTGVLYSPASVLGGAALAAAPPDERDALGDADEQAGLGGGLSSADTGGLPALQDQRVGAGDAAAQSSQWLSAFAQVAGRGGTGATGALGLDVVV